MEFKDILKTKRDAVGISQAELAEKLDVTRQTIIKWEKGDNFPDMTNLLNLSKIFDVSIDELVGNDRAIIFDSNTAPEKVETSDDAKESLMLILAVLSLIIPYGIGLLLALYVCKNTAGKNRLTKVVCYISMVANTIRVLIYLRLQLLW